MSLSCRPQQAPRARQLHPCQFFNDLRNGFNRALHIAFDDKRNFGDIAVLNCFIIWSSEAARGPLALKARLAFTIFGNFARARFRFDHGKHVTCARHAPDPSTSTGAEGPAMSICSPWSLMSARTRPDTCPTTNTSPTRSVPRWINTVATGPRPCRAYFKQCPRPRVRHWLGFHHLGLQGNRLKQVVKACAGLRRHQSSGCRRPYLRQ